MKSFEMNYPKAEYGAYYPTARIWWKWYSEKFQELKMYLYLCIWCFCVPLSCAVKTDSRLVSILFEEFVE